MNKLNSVVTTMSVYRIGTNPIHDEGATTISITDEGGGPFLTLFQTSDSLEPNEIRVELDELDLVHSKAHVMMQQYEAAMKLGEKDESSKD